MAEERKPGRYEALILELFRRKYMTGAVRVPFERKDLTLVANDLDVRLPSNVGDVVYTYRFRRPFPPEIAARAPEGCHWVIRGTGRGRYEFAAVADEQELVPRAKMAVIKVPDNTPGIISLYAMDDEQALLAKLRYNRLVDIFTGVTCYSLQNHLRTYVANVGQIEVDELYVGVGANGTHYVLPVQAKGHNDNLNIVQIEQDLAFCQQRFPELCCRPVAAQFLAGGVIALFSFQDGGDGPEILSERHYHLVLPSELTADDLRRYREQSPM